MPLPNVADQLWKEIIENHFDLFVEYFLPELFPKINFSKQIEFLKQELEEITAQNKRKGRKNCDCLVKVFLKNGKSKWILIHIEVEGSGKANFSERMYIYNYRAFDKFKVDIVALGIATGENIPKNLGIYKREFFGTKLIYEYNTFVVKNQYVEVLQNQQNPFALAILACLYVMQTKNAYKKRLNFKLILIRLLFERNYNRHAIVSFLKFIKLLVTLPLELEMSFREITIQKYKKEEKMITFSKEDKQFALDFINATFKDPDENPLVLLEKVKREKEIINQEKIQERKKAIIGLNTRGKMNAEEISEFMKLDLDFVKEILKENDLI